MHLAQMNVATALYDLDDERMADFMNNLERVNAIAEKSPGFVWRVQGDSGNATGIKTTDDPRFIVNMSVWESVEALFGYVYRSDHRGVMVRRREWFTKPDGPYMVLWWVEEGRMPTVEEGLARLKHLADHGPTPHAFTFKAMFPADAAEPRDLKPDPYRVSRA